MKDRITLKIEYVLGALVSCTGPLYIGAVDVKIPVDDAITLIKKAQKIDGYDELMSAVSKDAHQIIEESIRRAVDIDGISEEVEENGYDIFVESEILDYDIYKSMSQADLVNMILRNPEKYGFDHNEDLPPILRLHII